MCSLEEHGAGGDARGVFVSAPGGRPCGGAGGCEGWWRARVPPAMRPMGRSGGRNGAGGGGLGWGAWREEGSPRAVVALSWQGHVPPLILPAWALPPVEALLPSWGGPYRPEAGPVRLLDRPRRLSRLEAARPPLCPLGDVKVAVASYHTRRPTAGATRVLLTRPPQPPWASTAPSGPERRPGGWRGSHPAPTAEDGRLGQLMPGLYSCWGGVWVCSWGAGGGREGGRESTGAVLEAVLR